MALRPTLTGSLAPDGTPHIPRTFVPVEDLASPGRPPPAVTPPVAEPAPDPGSWSLWGDAET